MNTETMETTSFIKESLNIINCSIENCNEIKDF
jgi:hypothetical protein